MIHCPHCRGSIAEMPELAGQLLTCPHCFADYQQPSSDIPPLLPKPLVLKSGATVKLGQRPARRSNLLISIASLVLASLLSLVLPGLGQLTQGRLAHGMAFMIGWLLAICLALIAWPAIFIVLIVMIWSSVDAGSCYG